MTKEMFYNYIRDNFNINSETLGLIWNILNYVQNHASNENEQYTMLCELLDNTIGLNDNEIKMVCL